MIAIKRLQSIMWILIVAAGALSAYLITLRVATERNAVAAVERQIYATRANIRYLELEFSARSTMRQLATWNARDIKYAVPSAAQYIASEQQLAVLDAIEPREMPRAAPPVMAAMAQAEPAVPASAPVRAATRDTGPDFSLVRSAVAAEPVRPRAAVAIATPKAETAPRVVKLMDKADPAERRATRLALLEEALLDTRAPVTAERSERGRAENGRTR